VLGEDIVERYLATLTVPEGPRDLRIVYTPMHGVGGRLAVAALEAAGFPSPVIVEQQFEPDPAFPTVAFPNPEEPVAMDLALAAAASADADLVIANDPDADRCAAAVRVSTGSTNEASSTGVGAWRMLRGDEVGALLGHHLLSTGVEGTYACSLVSSSLLGTMAASYGQHYVETLTGFKWIGRLPGLVFGYEEALGYCVDPARVKDKDGLSAMLLLCDLAARLKASGKTLLDRLAEIYQQYGVHVTDQLSLRVDDLSKIAVVMARLREAPPASLGGMAVTRLEDLQQHEPPTDGLRFRLDGARVVVRPSGTEPKLKCYLEAVGDGAAERLAAMKADIAALVAV
jgi:phosphomannomutase